MTVYRGAQVGWVKAATQARGRSRISNMGARSNGEVNVNRGYIRLRIGILYQRMINIAIYATFHEADNISKHDRIDNAGT
jgi:hypothetical protein